MLGENLMITHDSVDVITMKDGKSCCERRESTNLELEIREANIHGL